jgi:8-oxo-dGTP diphosphatase
MNKASKIVIVNSRKEFLLQLRDEREDIASPGYWSFFGGGVENGESYLRAMKREILEEIGIEPLNMRKIKTIYIPKHYQNPSACRIAVFRADLDTSVEDINLTEGKDVRYFPLEELQEIKFPYVWLDFILKNKDRIFRS